MNPGVMETVNHFQSMQVAIEIWGIIFCVVAAFGTFMMRSYDYRTSNMLINSLVLDALMLCSDVVAVIYRGRLGKNAFYIVRISNFCVFFFGFLLIVFLSKYFTCLIENRSNADLRMWLYIQYLISAVAIASIIVNLFFPFLYAFDDKNRYYRLPYNFFIASFAILGLALLFSLVIVHWSKFTIIERVALISFLSLPLISILIQVMFYGISYTFVTVTISTMMLYISNNFNYAHHMVEQETALNEARIRMLQQQMKPHFIFNSLNVIRNLCRKESNQGSESAAVKAINEFASYLREVTDVLDETECIEFMREIEIVRHYVYMQKLRFPDSIEYQEDLIDTDFLLPAFCIQTMVENAINHGIRESEEGKGTVKISSRLEGKYHVVIVSDDGAGFEVISPYIDNKKHVGTANVRKRLDIMSNGLLEVYSAPGEGTVIKILVPVT